MYGERGQWSSCAVSAHSRSAACFYRMSLAKAVWCRGSPAKKASLPVRTARGASVRHFFLGKPFLFFEKGSVGFFFKAIHVDFRALQGVVEIPAKSEGEHDPAQYKKFYCHSCYDT